MKPFSSLSMWIRTALLFTLTSSLSAAGPTDAKPLLVGHFPDPTVVKDGDDYYMTHSSCEWYPGLLIFHSRDLKTWKPIAHAVTNHPASIWAPDLIKHKDLFYLYYPGRGNFVVTAKHPRGPWSAPVNIGLPGIDPGHVVGADGKRTIHASGGIAAPLSDDGLKATGKPKKVYAGWPIPGDWKVECFCLESPKFTRRGEYIYLTSAEGGTAGPPTSHMVVSARSRHPLGPWENSPHNPIIHTYSKDEAWWSKGHGTLVEGPDGHWYCILHGYKNDDRTIGRCTLIEPIEWTDDGWFKRAAKWPAGWGHHKPAVYSLDDDFSGDTLALPWQFFQRFEKDRFTVAGGLLTLKGRGKTPGDSRPLSPIPLHTAYEIETRVDVTGQGSAGLIAFYRPNVYAALSLASDGTLSIVCEGPRKPGRPAARKLTGKRVTMRMVNRDHRVRFFFRDGEDAWTELPVAVDISGWHHNALRGWHTVRPGLFVAGRGEGRFEYFKVRPVDQTSPKR